MTRDQLIFRWHKLLRNAILYKILKSARSFGGCWTRRNFTKTLKLKQKLKLNYRLHPFKLKPPNTNRQVWETKKLQQHRHRDSISYFDRRHKHCKNRGTEPFITGHEPVWFSGNKDQRHNEPAEADRSPQHRGSRDTVMKQWKQVMSTI